MTYDKDAIRSVRDRLGLSRVVFARFLGVSELTVVRWENGNADPRGIALAYIHMLRVAADRHGRDPVRDAVVGNTDHCMALRDVSVLAMGAR